MTYITSWERKGIEIGLGKGRAEGRAEGMLEHAQSMAIKLVTSRFGECSRDLVEIIEQLPLETLDLLPEYIFALTSLDDLRAWLHKNKEALK